MLSFWWEGDEGRERGRQGVDEVVGMKVHTASALTSSFPPSFPSFVHLSLPPHQRAGEQDGLLGDDRTVAPKPRQVVLTEGGKEGVRE